MKKELSYTDAMQELELLVRDIEEGKLSIDDLTSKVKRATELVHLCKEKLHATDKELEKVLAELEV